MHLQCEWLLGDRKPSPEELDKGIDPDSPLFQAILDNPVVQLGLTNPKTLLGTWPSLARACGTPQVSQVMGVSASVRDSCLSHCGAGAQALPAGWRLCAGASDELSNQSGWLVQTWAGVGGTPRLDRLGGSRLPWPFWGEGLLWLHFVCGT